MTDTVLRLAITKLPLMGFAIKSGILCLLACALVGCEQGPAVAPVTGVVTHDSVPLANAKIEFQPDKGAPSYAITNADGSYDLQYQTDRRGALLGHHFVSVIMKGEVTDPETDETRNVPETVPRAFNDETTLEYEVKKGDNEFNIEITGKREPGFDRGF